MTTRQLFMLGDSISLHYGEHLPKMLPADVLYRRKGQEGGGPLLDFDEANGGDSSLVLEYLERNEAWRACDLLLVNCGLHDIKVAKGQRERQVPLTSYVANLRAVVELAEQAGARLVWARTTPVDDAIHAASGGPFDRFSADCEAYNAAADEIMAEAGVPVIDLHAFTASLGEPLYCDHVHFHEHVREKQAAFVAGWVSGFLSR